MKGSCRQVWLFFSGLATRDDGLAAGWRGGRRGEPFLFLRDGERLGLEGGVVSEGPGLGAYTGEAM